MAARLLVEHPPQAEPSDAGRQSELGLPSARSGANYDAPFTFEQLREVLVDGERSDRAVTELLTRRGTPQVALGLPAPELRASDDVVDVAVGQLAPRATVDLVGPEPREDHRDRSAPTTRPGTDPPAQGARGDVLERIADGQIGGDDFALWPGVKLTGLVRPAPAPAPAVDDQPARSDGLESAEVVGDSCLDLADPGSARSSARTNYLVVDRSLEGTPVPGEPVAGARGFELDRVVTLARPHLSVGDGVDGDGFAELVSAVRDERGDPEDPSTDDDSPVIWSDRGYQPPPQIDVGIQVYDEPTIIRRAAHGEGIAGDGLDDLLIDDHQAHTRWSQT